MDTQQILSLLIVALSALLLARRQIRKQRRAKLRPCGHDCGCSTIHPDIADTIKYAHKEGPGS